MLSLNPPFLLEFAFFIYLIFGAFWIFFLWLEITDPLDKILKMSF